MKIRTPHRRRTGIIPILAGLLLTMGSAGAQVRTFTSTDGRTLDGSVLKVAGDAAVLKLTAGRSVTVPFDLLIEADREYLREWAKKEAMNRIPRVDVSIASNKRDTNVQQGYDDRRGSVQFEIEITNEERNFPIEGATATLVVFGQYLYQEDTLLVIQRTEFKDIEIEFTDTKRLHAEEVRYEYDKRDYTHGVKYDGYLFVFRNSLGKMIDISGSSSRVESDHEAILKLKEGEYCDEQYKKLNRSTSGTSILR